jgi:hypothetical protein
VHFEIETDGIVGDNTNLQIAILERTCVMRGWKYIFCGVVFVTILAAHAAETPATTPAMPPAPPPPEALRTRVEVDQQLARFARRQFEIQDALARQESTNAGIEQDPRFSTPEIDKLRKRVAALQMELGRTQFELREQVLALPAAKAELEKATQLRAEAEGNGRRVVELQKRREQLP